MLKAVLECPLGGILRAVFRFPGVVDVYKRLMVRTGVFKSVFSRLLLRKSILVRPRNAQPDRLCREHAKQISHVLGASLRYYLRSQQSFAISRIKRKLGKLVSQSSQLTIFVDSIEQEELLEVPAEALLVRLVQKVKVEHVLDSHRLQHKHGLSQVDTFDLWEGAGWHLLSVEILGVQAKALTLSRSTGTTGALDCLNFADWNGYE